MADKTRLESAMEEIENINNDGSSGVYSKIQSFRRHFGTDGKITTKIISNVNDIIILSCWIGVFKNGSRSMISTGLVNGSLESGIGEIEARAIDGAFYNLGLANKDTGPAVKYAQEFGCIDGNKSIEMVGEDSEFTIASEKQVTYLAGLVKQTETSLEKLLEHYGKADICEMSKAEAKEAIELLVTKSEKIQSMLKENQ